MKIDLDKAVFYGIFNFSIRHLFIGRTAVFITKLSSKLFYALYISVICLLLFKLDIILVPFLLIPASTLVAVKLVRYLLFRPRPFVSLDIKSLIYHKNSSSFPSQHSSSAFVIAASVLYVYYPLGIISLVVAFITGLSRVMVGVHYPSDIIVGALMGLTFAILGFSLFNNVFIF